MKRYRVFRFSFDSRALYLDEIKESWDDDTKESHRQNQYQIIQGIISEYGSVGFREKVERFKEIGQVPFSFSEANCKLNQIRDAFVVGAYYPALTAACLYAEFLMNTVLLEIRNDYKHTASFKKVSRQKHFQNWNLMIETLNEWDVFSDRESELLQRLLSLRVRAAHFDQEMLRDPKPYAIEAFQILREFMVQQFGILNGREWWIPAAGMAVVRKCYEENPFVQKFILPSSRSVGPLHRVEFVNHQQVLRDADNYIDSEVSDEEWIDLYEKGKNPEFASRILKTE